MPRSFLRCLLSGVLGWMYWSSAGAQDTRLVLDTTRLSSGQLVNLAELNGWLFSAGHNPAWANPGTSSATWRAFKPADLSVRNADEQGKVEGWFRLNIQLDSTWRGMALGLRNGSWAAADVYLDGRWVASFGNTGANGKPYQAHYYVHQPAIPIPFIPEKNHLLAIHVVDYVSAFPQYPGRKLQSEALSSTIRLLQLTGPQYPQLLLNSIRENVGYVSLWFGIWLLVTIGFWLLSWLNFYEKTTLQLLGVAGTFATISNLGRLLLYRSSSFPVHYGKVAIITLSLWLTIVFILLILMTIFGYRVRRKWFYGLIIVAIAGAAVDMYVGGDAVISMANLMQQAFIAYLLLSSWKRLRGAQWAIVVGALVSIVAAAVFAVFTFVQLPFNFNLLFSVISLAFPFSFVVYIALRFREILADVRKKADALVQITEEKRLILATENQRLEQQVEARTAELKASQAQLIQKEKLAGLGELTAGIAHEIQNPLNFVNNFSEVSAELVEELKAELERGETAEVRAIADDLSQNLQKIHHHGSRASRIVKGMLEHSRATTGERQPTDLNALANEYLRLAYQGQRTKDKDFRCEVVTDFDPTLGKVEVVPAEIGRVLLNLLSNAFYAITEQRKARSADYTPTVWVDTCQKTGPSNRRVVEIRVADNGIGIAESVRGKIFQPFFTTKPTGEGTGLGLSLSYDIVTKGHQGSLQVTSREAQGTEFIIELPQQN
ncbi:ATP-binding protein [Larkinella sp. VNQ87]|uniref:ATP-binding protein n=1 Tax=Larkinella sp. VNQ87 TaxID=3400921 RepID=UPI003C09B511